MEKFVSIIIPVYNDQEGLKNCLNAIYLQTYNRNKYEIIVIDNGSKEPIYIEKEKIKNLKIILCEKKGSYSARNAGIDISKGEILAFTDADCIPDKEWLKNGVNSLCKENEKYFIGGNVNLLLPENSSIIAHYQYLIGFMQKENIEKKKFSVTANLFATKEQFVEVGKFDERLLSGGDLEWCHRSIANGFSIKYAPEVIVTTKPRDSIAAAIRQTRRVAGGRFLLRRYKLSNDQSTKGNYHRSSLESLIWIVKHSELSMSKKINFLGIGMLLRLIHFLETIRLQLFGEPERR